MGICYFFLFSLFEVPLLHRLFRYRYSATFLKIAMRFSLLAIATFLSVLRTASILELYLPGKDPQHLTLNHGILLKQTDIPF
jgi:hypothetical protein